MYYQPIYSAVKGDKTITCSNYYTGQDITIPLDTELSPIDNAKKYFDKADELFPETVTCYNRDGSTYKEDGPASVFSARCTKNITEGIPPNWDGVVNLVSK